MNNDSAAFEIDLSRATARANIICSEFITNHPFFKCHDTYVIHPLAALCDFLRAKSELHARTPHSAEHADWQASRLVQYDSCFFDKKQESTFYYETKKIATGKLCTLTLGMKICFSRSEPTLSQAKYHDALRFELIYSINLVYLCSNQVLTGTGSRLS